MKSISKAKIRNIFCIIDLKQRLDIEDALFEKYGFEPMVTSNALLFSYGESKNKDIKFMIFPSGKVFLIGAKSYKEIESSFWFLIKKLKEVYKPLKLYPKIDISIQNILAEATLQDYLTTSEKRNEKFLVNLEKLSNDKNAEYDPRKFPGVFIKFPSQDFKSQLGTAIVFSSGRVLVGDVKCKEDADIVVEKIIEKIK